MAINSITFGGVNSADYGIYISGEGVFDAPKREVEMVSIPGRNGDLCIDHGRFKNIEVTYPAFNYEAEYDGFVRNLADFRNAISSQKGYQRLSDTFHPDEYRMATFIDGLEIEPIKYNTASEFNIVFNCKPQRYLTSGETSVSVDSGDTLTNPTRFESSPLLEVEGYGNIQFGGYEISLDNATVGQVSLVDARQGSLGSGAKTVKVPINNTSLVNTGDSVTVGEIHLTDEINNVAYVRSVTASDSNAKFSTTATVGATSGTANIIYLDTVISSSDVSFGDTLINESNTVTVTVTGVQVTRTATISYEVTAGPTDTELTITKTAYTTEPIEGRPTPVEHGGGYSLDGITAESTKTFLGHPTYIDCDLGIAYRIDNEEVTSLDAYIDLGSDLPTLAPGGNEVTFDNTITSLDIVPRWWKI